MAVSPVTGAQHCAPVHRRNLVRSPELLTNESSRFEKVPRVGPKVDSASRDSSPFPTEKPLACATQNRSGGDSRSSYSIASCLCFSLYPLKPMDQINWAARERCVARASDHHQHAFGPRPSNLNTFLTALFDPAIFLNSVFARARPGGCPWYPVGKNCALQPDAQLRALPYAAYGTRPIPVASAITARQVMKRDLYAEVSAR